MRSKTGNVLIIIGCLLLLSSVSLVGFNFYDNYRASKTSDSLVKKIEVDLSENVNALPSEIPDYILNPDMKMPVKKIDGYDCIGTLEIPALNRKLPVMSAWTYSLLEIAPCRYSGTAYKDDFIIAAHNYNSHFGNIKNLKVGDEIYFTDNDNNKFSYRVSEIEILQPTAVEQIKSGEWDLTLFTCTFGGSYRVTVRCEKEA